MATDKIMMGLDIGTSWTRAVVGSVNKDGQLMVDSICEKQSEGVRFGSIVNIEQTLKVINSVINEAELQAGSEVHSVILGVGGNHIEGTPSNGVVGITNKEHEIKREDIYRSLDVARAVELPQDREFLHTLVQDFQVDTRTGIKDPIDMLGHRLESRVLLVSGSSSICQNQRKCVQKAGLQVQRMILQSVADSEIVLSVEEKEMGTILINIGAGTSNMIAYVNGAPMYTGGINIGSDNVTNDIAFILNKPKAMAEQIKCENGACHIPSVDPNDMIIIPQVGGLPAIKMPKRELSKIIEPRMAEIFSMLQIELEKNNISGGFGGGVVLVGGGSLLSGATELASEIFKLPARIGFPEALSGLDRSYIDPRYATVLGLLKTEAKKLKDTSNNRVIKEKKSFSAKIKNVFGKLF
ncbi:MAG: cell division protein FtsA [Spirochaetales bacterium]|nr:cell division protein FtsA [Spirochaetales bacterium]